MLFLLDASKRFCHLFSHKVIGLESGIFIERGERLLYRRIVAVYYFHIQVLELVVFLLDLRLLGCAGSLLILYCIWPRRFWDLNNPLLVTVILFDLEATELLSVDFFVDFLTYWIFLIPGAH